jgi:wyosine [tRNA(Phe)-imidazoG37] synthetase (radical SAM superfamily)
MNIIFGPVNSRRFGKSLGVDLSPSKKQCNFDCLYCELEPSKTINEYEDILSVDEIIKAISKALLIHTDISVITITANGEPTLYPYLYELMIEINKIKKDIKTLILSNGSTINSPKVQRALKLFDMVKLSLDCATQKCLKKLDRAYSDIKIEDIKEGMLDFRKKYKNSLIIEILFVKNINNKDKEIEELNKFLLELNPTRVDIGTIDRPPAYKVEALTYEELRDISLKFNPKLPIYIVSRKKVVSKPSFYSKEEIIDTIKKRPLTWDDIEVLFDEKSKKIIKEMIKNNQLKIISSSGYDFFVLNSQKELKNS